MKSPQKKTSFTELLSTGLWGITILLVLIYFYQVLFVELP